MVKKIITGTLTHKKKTHCFASDTKLTLNFLEAEKKAQVSKIEWEQKITEKESQKKISQIEGI